MPGGPTGEFGPADVGGPPIGFCGERGKGGGDGVEVGSPFCASAAAGKAAKDIRKRANAIFMLGPLSCQSPTLVKPFRNAAPGHRPKARFHASFPKVSGARIWCA